MKPITLRNLPDHIARRIIERSRQTGASLNKTVIEMLCESGSAKKTRLHHDLDHLAGAWTAQEAHELDRLMETQRVIDPDLWP